MSLNPIGIDVYHGDGTVDWRAVAGAGWAFALAKSSEGMTVTDSAFAANWAGMKAAKLLRGAYHFGRPDRGSDGRVETNATAQAERFFGLVGALGYGDLPPVLDLETAPTSLTPTDVVNWTRAFLVRAKALFQRTPILYVGKYWRTDLGDPVFPEAAECPLWTARYSAEEPILPRQWSRWTIWQYSDGTDGPATVPVPGLSSPPDQNIFNGTLDDLRELAGIPRWPGRSFVYPQTPMLSGDDVRRWQARMVELKYTISVDGYYGRQSQSVCKQLQTSKALTVDGVVGPKTWAASFF